MGMTYKHSFGGKDVPRMQFLHLLHEHRDRHTPLVYERCNARIAIDLNDDASDDEQNITTAADAPTAKVDGCAVVSKNQKKKIEKMEKKKQKTSRPPLQSADTPALIQCDAAAV
jgi:hypothetical protein